MSLPGILEVVGEHLGISHLDYLLRFATSGAVTVRLEFLFELLIHLLVVAWDGAAHLPVILQEPLWLVMQPMMHHSELSFIRLKAGLPAILSSSQLHALQVYVLESLNLLNFVLWKGTPHWATAVMRLVFTVALVLVEVTLASSLSSLQPSAPCMTGICAIDASLTVAWTSQTTLLINTVVVLVSETTVSSEQEWCVVVLPPDHHVWMLALLLSLVLVEPRDWVCNVCQIVLASPWHITTTPDILILRDLCWRRLIIYVSFPASLNDRVHEVVIHHLGLGAHIHHWGGVALDCGPAHGWLARGRRRVSVVDLTGAISLTIWTLTFIIPAPSLILIEPFGCLVDL